MAVAAMAVAQVEVAEVGCQAWAATAEAPAEAARVEVGLVAETEVAVTAVALAGVAVAESLAIRPLCNAADALREVSDRSNYSADDTARSDEPGAVHWERCRGCMRRAGRLASPNKLPRTSD